MPALATLGILSEPQGLEDLPTDQIATERNWRTSDVVPMGGRLIFERVSCGTNEEEPSGEAAVRLFVNDGLIDLTGLPHAVPFTDVEGAISVQSFQTLLSARGRELGDFRAVCGLSGDAPDRIKFLHQ